MTGKCWVELPPPKAESTPRNRSAMQYKVHTVLEIRPGLLSPLKPKIASPKWDKESQERKVWGTYCKETEKRWLYLECYFLTWLESMNTYALNFFISGFLLQENLFKYESQILLYHVWYRNISGNIKQIKFLRRLFWIEAILSIV